MPSAARTRVYATEAIPLKRMDFGEADRIITLFTPALGKIRVIARGVRRSTSRMAGHLELFTHAHLMLARGRELDVATQASTVESFRGVREDLTKSSQAYHLAELVDLFLQDRDENRAVFLLLRDALEALSGSAIVPELVARHFELQLLSAVGFRPQLYSCLACETPIQAEANAYSVPLGGVLCPECATHEPTARSIATDTLKLLRFLQRTGSVATVGVAVPATTLRDAERLLREVLEAVLERRLRAAEFVHQVAEAVAGYRT
jgi:DNA repair protein RecO (recombination protein O)